MNPLKIIKFIKDNKLTKSEFCKMCKIKISLLDSIVYYGQIIEYAITERIAKAMGIGVYELFTY